MNETATETKTAPQVWEKQVTKAAKIIVDTINDEIHIETSKGREATHRFPDGIMPDDYRMIEQLCREAYPDQQFIRKINDQLSMIYNVEDDRLEVRNGKYGINVPFTIEDLFWLLDTLKQHLNNELESNKHKIRNI